MSGDEIRAWRKRMALSQTELAKLLNVRVMTVSDWERDKAKPAPYLALALVELGRRIRAME